MNDSNKAIIIFSAIAWLIIMYYLILNAVKAGTKKQTFLLQMQNRMLMNMLIKEGYTAEEIEKLHDDPYDEFYFNKLKSAP